MKRRSDAEIFRFRLAWGVLFLLWIGSLLFAGATGDWVPITVGAVVAVILGLTGPGLSND